MKQQFVIRRLGSTSIYLIYPIGPVVSDEAVFGIHHVKSRFEDKGYHAEPLSGGWSRETKDLYGPEVRAWADDLAHRFNGGAVVRREACSVVHEVEIS